MKIFKWREELIKRRFEIFRYLKRGEEKKTYVFERFGNIYNKKGKREFHDFIIS